MIQSLKIVETARKLIGTPYLHQGRLPGKGCDCLGVPVLVGLELGLFDSLSDSQKDTILNADYHRNPDGSMGDKIASICKPIVIARGALLVFKIRKAEQHCGIVSDYMGGLGLIHAWDTPGINKVCEHRLTRNWMNDVTGCYGLPGVNYG